jgi:predicted nucleotidyltransferase
MLEKSNIEIILREIFAYPTTKYTIRELARKTKLSPPTALRIIRTLQKEGVIRETVVGRASQISANLDSAKYKWMKRLANLKNIYECGIIEGFVDTYNDPQAIILFGSYSRGEDIERSDIDIAVITGHKHIADVSTYEKKLGRAVSVHCITLDRVSEEFKSNLCNGIILHGAL